MTQSHSRFHSLIRRASVVFLTFAMATVGMISGWHNGVYAVAEPAVRAESVVVMSGSTGEIVYGQHQDRKMPMAGTAKLMAGIVVLDRMHDDSELKNIVQISTDVAKHGDRFTAGDKVSVRDLMYAMLMDDSNEAAEALAIYSAGSDTAFIECMNAKAKELGIIDTNYRNVTGKYSQKQFSTVEETAKLLRKAMEYPMLEDILTESNHKVEVKGKTKDFDLKWNTKVKASGLRVSKAFKASNNDSKSYIGFASDDGMDMIVVMFGSYGDYTSSDATTLFKYGFDNVTRQQIVPAGKEEGKVRVRGGEHTRIPVYTKTKGYVYIPPEGSDSLIKTETYIYKNLKAPVKAGTKAGEYKIYVAGEYQGKVDLVVQDNVAEGWFPSRIYISNTATIVIGIILALLLALIARIKAVQRKRARLRRLERQRRIREIAERERAIEEDRRRRNWTYR